MISNSSDQHSAELRNDLETLTEPGQSIQLDLSFYALTQKIISEINIESKLKCRTDRLSIGAINQKTFKVYKVN